MRIADARRAAREAAIAARQRLRAEQRDRLRMSR
jgi:hypothetical protein